MSIQMILVRCISLGLAALVALPAIAAEHTADEHAAHRAAMVAPRYQVTSGSYEVPDVQLLDALDNPVNLRALLATEQPIALNFIFTTCTTICPVMSATFVQMQRELGARAADVRLVSISIDPEYDRPRVLRDYAERFGAGPNWTFLTGDGDDVANVLRSFGAYTGSKMNHRAVTLLRRPGSDVWVRIDGLTSGASLAQEVSTRILD